MVNLAVGVCQVLWFCLEHLGSDFLHFLEQFTAGIDYSITTHESQLGSHSVPVVGVGPGVDVCHDVYVFDRKIKFLGRDLGHGCVGTLADIHAADHHAHTPITIHLHDGRRCSVRGHGWGFLQNRKAFAAYLAGFPFALTLFFRLASGPADFLDYSREAILNAAGALRDQFAADGAIAWFEQIHHAKLVRINVKHLGKNVDLTFD